jgi:cytochrome c-type biogenesis protein CcmH/NrfG
MSAGVITSSARNGFVLGLSAGLVLASAFFLLKSNRPAAGLGVEGAPARVASSASTPASTPASMPVSMPASMTGSTETGAQSMETATLALKTRLATQGGSDEQWELLGQSYDFLGRGDEAALAREHRTAPDGDLRDAVAASAMLLARSNRPTAGGEAPQAKAGRAETLVASAEKHRRDRQFKEACAAYAEAAGLGAMTADNWADYADALASMAGHLAGEPEKALARALALDPRHTKALWLKASLAHEQHRYDVALATWRQLLALVPPDSSDARIVEANIAEATRLGNG